MTDNTLNDCPDAALAQAVREFARDYGVRHSRASALCVNLEQRARKIAAASPPPAGARDAVAWPSRFGCNGPEGSFWTDDSALANKLIAATYDRDEWTVTDTTNPTGISSKLVVDTQPAAPGAGEYDRGLIADMLLNPVRYSTEAVAEQADLLLETTAAAPGLGDALADAVNRFLCWPLPKDFAPDAGTSFQPFYPFGDINWPVGTNIFTADQAKAMFAHCVPALATQPEPDLVALVTENRCNCHPETCCCADYRLQVGDEFLATGSRACMDRLADLLNSRLAAQPAPVEQPRPMATAPKDGTVVRLLVRFTENGFEDAGPEKAVWTIGQNGADHHPEDDEWLFAGWNWEQDCFTQGVGEPIGWLPMIATPAQPAPVVGGDHSQLADKLSELLPHLEFSRQTHVEWRDCDQSWRDKNPSIGNSKFHDDCVKEYDQRITVIREAIGHLTLLAARPGGEGEAVELEAVAWVVFDSKHDRYVIFNKELAGAIAERGLLTLPVFGQYEWLDAKSDQWKPITRLPYTWERELGLGWREAAHPAQAGGEKG